MKKRVPIILIGMVIIFFISSVLFNRQATLNYGDVKEFCYEVQKAGHPISPDPETIKQYLSITYVECQDTKYIV